MYLHYVSVTISLIGLSSKVALANCPRLEIHYAQNPGEYKHVFGFEGRSQSQGLVERYNGTIKMMLRRRLAGRLGAEWKDYLDDAVKNYNANKHSTIKMAPDDVAPGNYATVKENILTKAKDKVNSRAAQLKAAAEGSGGSPRFQRLREGRSSKSQHRKAMLADWTKMSYKPVVVLYVERQRVLCERRCRQEMSQERDDQLELLETKNIKMQRRIDGQVIKYRDLKRDQNQLKNKYSSLETAILQAVDDKALFKINCQYDWVTNTHCGLGLKRRDEELNTTSLDERKEDFQNHTHILLTILKNLLSKETRTEIDDEFYEWTEKHVDLGLNRSNELYDTQELSPAKQIKKEEEEDIYSLSQR